MGAGKASTFAAAAAVVVGLSHAPPAQADIKDAEELFRRGKAAMAKGDYEKACPLFAESHKQDPATGTLLNLALCHEAIGRIASAWGEWLAVEQQARAATPVREERVKMAREHAEKLEPRLSRLAIVVPPESRVPGLVVKVDGEEKGEPLFRGLPVDPGTRRIEVSAPGKKPATLEVKVDDEGVVVPVTIPKLEDAAPRPSSEAAATAASAPVAVANLDAVEEYAANRARRTTGFVVGGIGIATLAVGAVFGVLAVSRQEEAEQACPAPCVDGSDSARRADDATDRALVFANVSNVTLPLGALGAAIGAYLVLTAGPTARAAVSPFGARSATGMSVTARW